MVLAKDFHDQTLWPDQLLDEPVVLHKTICFLQINSDECTKSNLG
jgi:hypothetical protein